MPTQRAYPADVAEGRKLAQPVCLVATVSQVSAPGEVFACTHRPRAPCDGAVSSLGCNLHFVPIGQRGTGHAEPMLESTPCV